MKVLLLLLIIVSNSDGGRPSLPKSIRSKSTIGEVWPKPQSMSSTTQEYLINRDSFELTMNETSARCDLLTNALNRYYSIIFDPFKYISSFLHSNSFYFKYRNEINQSRSNVSDIPLLKQLFVYVQNECEQWPNIQSNESCESSSSLFIEFHLLFR